MPREVEPSLNERQFVLQALTENIRIDGRALDQYRPLELSFGDEYGVADIRLGNTRVLANISAEVQAPYPERPFDGLFTITTELSPMASPAFEAGRPTTTEVLLSRLLEKTLRRSGALDVESLCLIAAKKVWSVRADVHVLSHDGNLVDASCIAVLAALSHFRKPDVSVEGEVVTVFTAAERELVPLSILHHPFCVTFSFFPTPPPISTSSTSTTKLNTATPDDITEQITLLDPTHLEEQLRAGAMTISMNRHGEICQVAKLGGYAVDAVELLNCAAVAEVKVKEFHRIVMRALEVDKGRRDKGMGLELSAQNERIAPEVARIPG